MADASLHLSEDLFKKFLREHPKDLILVDFYADWCPHCQTVGPILENVARLYKSKKVWVVKIDTDAYDSLSREYKVDVL
ncbi:hypothetical protein IJI99_00250, partial [bacterium]|nr:hypothetical protein [bacterium]